MHPQAQLPQLRGPGAYLLALPRFEHLCHDVAANLPADSKLGSMPADVRILLNPDVLRPIPEDLEVALEVPCLLRVS